MDETKATTIEGIQAWTLREPYASGILLGSDPGAGAWKNVENRSQRRKIPPGGVWYGLHAGLGWSGDDIPDLDAGWWVRLVERARASGDGNVKARTPRGKMLGAFHVYACVPYPATAADIRDPMPADPHKLRTNDSAFGPFCYLIDRVVELPAAMPCRGMNGTWPIAKLAGEDVARALLDAIERAR